MQLFLSPDFNIKTLRKTPRSQLQKNQDQRKKILNHQLTNISKVLSLYIPQRLFDAHIPKGSRRRVFSYENTFWGFFLQTLQADSSCQSIVHQFNAVIQSRRKGELSTSTSAYCQARKRLPNDLLTSIFHHTNERAGSLHPLVNRRVLCADGTGLLAADTEDNQAEWPQQAQQKLGCGFPQIRLCSLFNLHSGLALDYRLGNKHSHEL